MSKQELELQELKGVGKVLSHSLCEASYDSIAKVAAASEKGLERITGFSPKKARDISTQARNLTGHAEKSHHSWSEQNDASARLVADATALKNR